MFHVSGVADVPLLCLSEVLDSSTLHFTLGEFDLKMLNLHSLWWSGALSGKFFGSCNRVLASPTHTQTDTHKERESESERERGGG